MADGAAVIQNAQEGLLRSGVVVVLFDVGEVTRGGCVRMSLQKTVFVPEAFYERHKQARDVSQRLKYDLPP